jgi:hypothetical protein
MRNDISWREPYEGGLEIQRLLSSEHNLQPYHVQRHDLRVTAYHPLHKPRFLLVVVVPATSTIADAQCGVGPIWQAASQ